MEVAQVFGQRESVLHLGHIWRSHLHLELALHATRERSLTHNHQRSCLARLLSRSRLHLHHAHSVLLHGIARAQKNTHQLKLGWLGVGEDPRQAGLESLSDGHSKTEMESIVLSKVGECLQRHHHVHEWRWLGLALVASFRQHLLHLFWVHWHASVLGLQYLL